ncbi:MAG: proline dehydrogenase family protein [Pseudomonadota bacterium]
MALSRHIQSIRSALQPARAHEDAVPGSADAVASDAHLQRLYAEMLLVAGPAFPAVQARARALRDAGLQPNAVSRALADLDANDARFAARTLAMAAGLVRLPSGPDRVTARRLHAERLHETSADVDDGISTLRAQLVEQVGAPVRAMFGGRSIVAAETALTRAAGALATVERAVRRARRQTGVLDAPLISVAPPLVRSSETAATYETEVASALADIARHVPGDRSDRRAHSAEVFLRPGLVVDLGALVPGFGPDMPREVRAEAHGRLLRLATVARRANVMMVLDAPHALARDAAFGLFQAVASDDAMVGWFGFGLSIAARDRAIIPALRRVRRAAASAGRRLPIRLVSGQAVAGAALGGPGRGETVVDAALARLAWMAAARFLFDADDAFHPLLVPETALDAAYAEALGAVKPADILLDPAALSSAGAWETAGHARLRLEMVVGSRDAAVAQLADLASARAAAAGGGPDARAPNGPAAVAAVEALTDIASLLDLTESAANGGGPEIQAALATASSSEIDQAIRTTRAVIHRIEATHAAAPSVDKVASKPDQAVQKQATLASETVICPAPDDRHTVAQDVVVTAPESVDAIVDAARAQAGAWAAVPMPERVACVRTFANLLAQRSDGVIAALVVTVGVRRVDAADAVSAACRAIHEMCDAAEPARLPAGVRRDGAGVVVIDSEPDAFVQRLSLTAAALIAGNAVISRIAPESGLEAERVARVWHAAGLDARLLQAVLGTTTLSRALASATGVNAFVTTRGAEAVANATAARVNMRLPMIPITSAAHPTGIALHDSTVDEACLIADIAAALGASAAPRGWPIAKVFIDEARVDDIAHRLADALFQTVVGDPAIAATTLGPVWSHEQRDRLIAEKVRLATRTETLADPPLPPGTMGWHVTPAIYLAQAGAGLMPRLSGPLLVVEPYDPADFDGLTAELSRVDAPIALSIFSADAALGPALVDAVRPVATRQWSGALALSGTAQLRMPPFLEATSALATGPWSGTALPDPFAPPFSRPARRHTLV